MVERAASPIIVVYRPLHRLIADPVLDIAGAAEVIDVDRSTDPEVLRGHLSRCHVIFGQIRPDMLRYATSLQWLQLPSAGADRYCDRSLYANPDVILTNASGVYGIPAAEHLLGMMLSFVRGINDAIRQQQSRTWWDSEYKGKLAELQGATLGILGYGDIGLQLAIRAKAMGMHVLAMKRRAEVSTAGPPQPVDELFGPEGLDEILRRSDHLAICLPFTAKTKRLISAERLRLMKPTAYLYNVGRGGIIDEAALIDALAAGRLAGAGLDVFETEPLPTDSPLWSMNNVIVSPHIAGASVRDMGRIVSIFVDNFRRFVKGERLHHVVDIDERY